VVIVLGGPNGAGKTTSSKEVLPHELHLRQFVNADVIASGLSGFAPETVALQAGRIMLQRLEELAAAREDFAFETTLASRSFAPFLRRLKADGYFVHLLFVWLRAPELAVERVADRVSRGGHHIPTDVIHRRYERGIVNFWSLYRPIADAWIWCDNSGEQRVVVARGSGDEQPEVLDERLFAEYQRQVSGL
jgi:predicted ABC-type ATPase